MCACLSHAPPMGTRPTTQACALTGEQTGNPLVHKLALSPLSHTNQGFLSNLDTLLCGFNLYFLFVLLLFAFILC